MFINRCLQNDFPTSATKKHAKKRYYAEKSINDHYNKGKAILLHQTILTKFSQNANS